MLDIDNGICLIKFAATWCAPCKFVGKTIEKVLPDFPSVKFQDIDIDDFPALAKNYKIRSVPTVIVFRDGAENTKLVGNFTEDCLKEKLKEITKDIAA